MVKKEYYFNQLVLYQVCVIIINDLIFCPSVRALVTASWLSKTEPSDKWLANSEWSDGPIRWLKWLNISNNISLAMDSSNQFLDFHPTNR